MSRMMITICVSAAFGIVVPAAAAIYGQGASPAPLSKDGHAQASASAQARVDRQACISVSGNAKDTCQVQATGKERTAAN